MEGTLSTQPTAQAATPSGSTAAQIGRGVVAAFAVVAIWLTPMTIYGLIYVHLLIDLEWAILQLLIGISFVLGYAGFVTTPIISAVVGTQRLHSTPSAVSAAATALIIYLPASVVALALILYGDPVMGSSKLSFD